MGSKRTSYEAGAAGAVAKQVAKHVGRKVARHVAKKIARKVGDAARKYERDDDGQFASQGRNIRASKAAERAAYKAVGPLAGLVARKVGQAVAVHVAKKALKRPKKASIRASMSSDDIRILKQMIDGRASGMEVLDFIGHTNGGYSEREWSYFVDGKAWRDKVTSRDPATKKKLANAIFKRIKRGGNVKFSASSNVVKTLKKGDATVEIRSSPGSSLFGVYVFVNGKERTSDTGWSKSEVERVAKDWLNKASKWKASFSADASGASQLQYKFPNERQAQDFVHDVLRMKGSRGSNMVAAFKGHWAIVLRPGPHAADISDLARQYLGKPFKASRSISADRNSTVDSRDRPISEGDRVKTDDGSTGTVTRVMNGFVVVNNKSYHGTDVTVRASNRRRSISAGSKRFTDQDLKNALKDAKAKGRRLYVKTDFVTLGKVEQEGPGQWVGYGHTGGEYGFDLSDIEDVYTASNRRRSVRASMTPTRYRKYAKIVRDVLGDDKKALAILNKHGPKYVVAYAREQYDNDVASELADRGMVVSG